MSRLAIRRHTRVWPLLKARSSRGVERCAVRRGRECLPALWVLAVILGFWSTDMLGGEMPVDANDPSYHVGQRWSYHTRPGEEQSSFTIVKIEQDQQLGTVVHISIAGVRVRNPHTPTGYSETIGHMPLSREAIEKSVTALLEERASLPAAWQDGYDEWRRAVDEGRGGAFSIPVKDAVEYIEQTINQ